MTDIFTGRWLYAPWRRWRRSCLWLHSCPESLVAETKLQGLTAQPSLHTFVITGKLCARGRDVKNIYKNGDCPQISAKHPIASPRFDWGLVECEIFHPVSPYAEVSGYESPRTSVSGHTKVASCNCAPIHRCVQLTPLPPTKQQHLVCYSCSGSFRHRIFCFCA